MSKGTYHATEEHVGFQHGMFGKPYSTGSGHNDVYYSRRGHTGAPQCKSQIRDPNGRLWHCTKEIGHPPWHAAGFDRKDGLVLYGAIWDDDHARENQGNDLFEELGLE